MAVYFSLHHCEVSRDTAILQLVDEAMCKYLDVPVDATRWYKNWYNTVGLGIALGLTWTKLREIWTDKHDVIDYLEAYYLRDAWYMHRR